MMAKDRIYTVTCPKCNNTRDLVYKTYWAASKHNFVCRSCSLKGNKGNTFGSMTGKKQSLSARLKMSISATKDRKLRSSDEEYLKKLSESVKLAMHRPEIRKKHLDALSKTKWVKVKTDDGQLELLEKWNRLGFHFEPNYQVHTDTDLFYIDGYDKEHNVVLEYDSRYHNKPSQKEKDLIRQNKIIDILKPKKFWRYNAVNKQVKNVLN